MSRIDREKKRERRGNYRQESQAMALLHSRNSKTISGKMLTGKKTKPTCIKPAKTRKIIRRFHFLIKSRKQIIQKLTSTGSYDELLKISENSEPENKTILFKFFRKNKNKNKKNQHDGQPDSKMMEEKLLKLHSYDKDGSGKSSISVEEYIALLKYINDEMYTNGGLQKYQLASMMGQDKQRGGDSSKILIKWLKELNTDEGTLNKYTEMNALEIGSLDTNNYISRSPKLISTVERIDLNSNNEEQIKKQDFMERPLAKNNTQQLFDLISCSLVLNFVPVPTIRGEMLRRMKKFLKTSQDSQDQLLFIVLPLPCVNNSRYINNELFTKKIMKDCLNFELLKTHESHKIAYYLFKETSKKENRKLMNEQFTKKKEIIGNGSGTTKNNFSILFQHT